MGGDIEGAGDLATGLLLARAVDPRGGAAQHADDAGGLCLNCGTARLGPHCHRCGQAGHIHRSLGAIWHDLLHGVLHFEGRLWKTLPMLALRPGELTRRYIEGERARFVSPMALFLFSVFTLFATLSILGIAPPADLGASSAQVSAGLQEQRAELVERRDRAIERRDEAPIGSPDRARQEGRIAEYDGEIATIDRIRPTFDRASNTSNLWKTGWKRLDYGIEKMNSNPGLALYKLQANSYKFSWLLIPLSVPFVWIMFAWRREFHMYDHAVFVTYSIGFMSLLFITLTILSAMGVPLTPLVLAGSIIPPIHIYRQLRGGYRLRRRWALVRTAVLLFFSIHVIAGLFLTLLIVLGLLG